MIFKHHRIWLISGEKMELKILRLPLVSKWNRRRKGATPICEVMKFFRELFKKHGTRGLNG